MTTFSSEREGNALCLGHVKIKTRRRLELYPFVLHYREENKQGKTRRKKSALCSQKGSLLALLSRTITRHTLPTLRRYGTSLLGDRSCFEGTLSSFSSAVQDTTSTQGYVVTRKGRDGPVFQERSTYGGHLACITPSSPLILRV